MFLSTVLRILIEGFPYACAFVTLAAFPLWQVRAVILGSSYANYSISQKALEVYIKNTDILARLYYTYNTRTVNEIIGSRKGAIELSSLLFPALFLAVWFLLIIMPFFEPPTDIVQAIHLLFWLMVTIKYIYDTLKAGRILVEINDEIKETYRKKWDTLSHR